MNKLFALFFLVLGVCFLPFFGAGIPMIASAMRELAKDGK